MTTAEKIIEWFKEQYARYWLWRYSPTNDELIELSKKHPPPQEWYDEWMEEL